MRHPTYLGPKIQVQPSMLNDYDNGHWIAEEKRDGYWAEAVTDDNGIIVKITGRSGKDFCNSNVDGLLRLKTGAPNCSIIAELEAGTEAANRFFSKVGFRRLWAFDIVRMLGQDVSHLPYEKRRELLLLLITKVNKHNIKVTQSVNRGFQAFFDDVMSRGGEGIVLKKRGSKYQPRGCSGKDENWIRCKRFRYVDYVVLEVGRSEGGSDNFQVGLYFDGCLKRVATIKNLPLSMTNPQSYVGKVIECKGLEVHSSGALRHGHYERLRDDKNVFDCTYEASQRS